MSERALIEVYYTFNIAHLECCFLFERDEEEEEEEEEGGKLCFLFWIFLSHSLSWTLSSHSFPLCGLLIPDLRYHCCLDFLLPVSAFRPRVSYPVSYDERMVLFSKLYKRGLDRILYRDGTWLDIRMAEL